MTTLGFPKSHRLLRPADYSQVFDRVTYKVPHRNFLILAAPNSLGHARVGLIFSKRNVKLAVQRNRIKRQVRETFRHETALPALDIVVLGRQGLPQLDNTEVHTVLTELWRRLRKKVRSAEGSLAGDRSPPGTGSA